MAQTMTVAPLRPAKMRSHPVRVEAVFDDPDAILARIRDGGPYQTTAAFHQLGETLGAGAARAPWFKTHLDDPDLLTNPRWTEAAKAAFGAAIVQPLAVALNLNAATPLGVPHLDLPRFRGFGAPEMPVWLLLNMAHSGLFHDWMVPYASGLAWFNAGEGGEFEYWPDGLGGASVIERGAMWNRGVVSDNEFMWHRVGAIGSPEAQARIAGLMHYRNEIAATAGGGWEIRRDGAALAELAAPEVRISLLWKAHVFTDEAHLESFADARLDLTLDQVVDIYAADLAAKGLDSAVPSDPLADDAWRERLMGTYAPPLEHLRG